jgi:predicted HTH transcriptional regulator
VEDVFELSKFDEYKEDNRREVKAAEGGLPKSLWDTYSSMHLAVREAIANCLVNADYFQRWSVVIERYPDRIVLSNPGTIIPGKKQMLRGGISEPRNRNLFKMFNLIGIGEHAGSGVPDIFDIWKNEGLKEPQVKEQFGAGLPDRTTMILPLMEAEADISEKSQAKSQVKSQIKKADQMERRAGSVLNVLRAEPTATTPKIAIMLGITERQVRTVLDQMKDQQILRFERHGRSGRWIINDSKTE